MAMTEYDNAVAANSGLRHSCSRDDNQCGGGSQAVDSCEDAQADAAMGHETTADEKGMRRCGEGREDGAHDRRQDQDRRQ